MNTPDDPDVQLTVLCWASQVCGKTQVIASIIGRKIDREPVPMLMVFPTLDLASGWAKKRFDTMVRDTPVLASKVRDSATTSTVLSKIFPGANLTLAGANAPSGLSSNPISDVYATEIDRFPPSAGEEGDPWSIAWKRTETFPNAFGLMESSPTIKGISRIEAELDETDFNKWFIPCLECGNDFVLMWKDVRWPGPDNEERPAPEIEPENAYVKCPDCGALFNDSQRMEMVKRGQWRPTKPFKGKRGYWLNGLVCLLAKKRGFKNRLHQFVADFLSAKTKGAMTMKTWVNTFCAESFEEAGDRPTAPEVLYARREEYENDEEGIILPERCVLLAVGADVQSDRIEAEIVGFGVGEETWGIEYRIFRGNIEQWSVWDEFDAWTQSKFRHVSGHVLQPAAVAVDSGHKPKMVNAFVRRCSPRAVFSVRGTGYSGIPWVTRSKTQKIALVKVNVAKEAVYARLNLIDHGPGYMHTPATYTLEWFQQLTSERLVTHYKFGVPYKMFEANGRNEALDARVYAMAAVELLRPNYRKLARRLAVERDEHADPAEGPQPESTPAQPAIAQPQPKPLTAHTPTTVRRIFSRGRSGWMQGM